MNVELPLTAWLLGVLTCAAALVALAALARGVLVRARWRATRAGRLAANALLAAFAGATALLALEVGVYLFGARSHSIDFTLASGRWYERHWRPLNSAGIRDLEPDPARLRATRRLVVLGDSIAAGHGIDSAGDRFPDRLRAALGPAWSVVLLAKPGWSSDDELRALRALPFAPDAVVLQYYVNDVESAARRHGRAFAPDLRVRPRALAPLVDASHLANLVYWRLWWARAGPALAQDFERHVAAAHADPEIWSAHRAELVAIAAETRARGAELLVVLFPQLGDVAGSRAHTARVADLLRPQAQVLDLGEVFASRGAAALVVSEVDAHPNAAVHAEVAEAILAALEPARR